MGGSQNLLKSLGLVKVKKSSDETKKVKKAKVRKWKFWKSSVHATDDKQEVVVRKPDYPHGSEDWAAVVIQTSFRGFKARRQLRAIKGVVRLQALVRGRTVRKQASITLRCMQTLVKVQRARQTRLSEASAVRAIVQRQIPVDKESEKGWSDGVRTKEEMRSRIQQKHDAAVKRERALAYAFSHQWRAHPRPATKGTSDNPEWEWGWLERWMAARPWESDAVEEALKKGLKNGVQNNKTSVQDIPAAAAAAAVTAVKSPLNGTKEAESFDSPKSVQSNGNNKFHFQATPGSEKGSPRSVKTGSGVGFTTMKANGFEKPVVKSRYMDHYLASKAETGGEEKARAASTPKQRPSNNNDQQQLELKKKRLSLPTSGTNKELQSPAMTPRKKV